MPDTSTPSDFPLAAWFLGPKAEYGPALQDWLAYIVQDYLHWRRNYFPTDPVIISRESRREHANWQDNLNTQLDTILNSLKADYPFYSPRYIAHMTSEQTIPSILGYFAGMLYNPNNVTDEAAPVTVRLELEVGRMVSAMLGYSPHRAWAHICSGGTIANLEALWVGRMAQCMPFILRDYAKRCVPDFVIKTASGHPARLTDLSPHELIGLRPNQAIMMTRQLARFEMKGHGRDPLAVLADINRAVRESPFNVKLRGFDALTSVIGMRPVIFVSAAAHYCIKKVAGVLGYGEDCVRLVPVTSQFRVDVGAMHDAIEHLTPSEYIAAVVGVVGTTEEGAVDPIHDIVLMRDALSKAQNRSFWLHVDAAWGGYIRSLFCGHAHLGEQEKLLSLTPHDFEAVRMPFTQAINAPHPIDALSGSEHISWDDPDVIKAFLALSATDSIALDPHKMGYVPYPAGIIAFKSGLVTELMTQRAQYISDEQEGVHSVEAMTEVNAVGPYILEGSKPGAAATACWLAHTTIPLNVHGHGQIVRVSVWGAKRLYRYLNAHQGRFAEHERVCAASGAAGADSGGSTTGGTGSGQAAEPFTFVPIVEPDTNIVCFVCVPLAWQASELRLRPVSLPVLNAINRRIHEELDIPKARRGMQTPYAKEYFVSRTKFERSQYSSQSLEALLERLGIVATDYDAHGLIVLRATVMNPLYDTARGAGMDYLAGFVQHLHNVARFVIERL